MMKTSIIAIALVATALASVDALKCEKYASGILASWEEVNLENGHVQHYAMKDGKLAKSQKGEEFDFYACEAPAKFHKNIKANRDRGAEKAGVIKTKDGKKCLTNSFIRVRDPSTDDKYHTGYKQVPENVEKKVTLEDCAEDGMDLRKQWFAIPSPLREGCSSRLLQMGYECDEPLQLTYGTKGVAFDTEGGQGTSLKNPDDYRNSYSFFVTEKVDASCVYMNP